MNPKRRTRTHRPNPETPATLDPAFIQEKLTEYLKLVGIDEQTPATEEAMKQIFHRMATNFLIQAVNLKAGGMYTPCAHQRYLLSSLLGPLPVARPAVEV